MINKLLTTMMIIVSMMFILNCTTIKVKPVPIEPKVETICVKVNPMVKHTSFLPALKKEFSYYGIKLRSFRLKHTGFEDEYPKEVIRQCDYIMTYVANWTWDMANYCWRIELHLYDRNNVEIADGLFELAGGKGGLAMNKWRSTESKIRELLVKFMGNYSYVIEPPKLKIDED